MEAYDETIIGSDMGLDGCVAIVKDVQICIVVCHQYDAGTQTHQARWQP